MKDKRFGIHGLCVLLICCSVGGLPALAEVYTQCPLDEDGIDTDGDGIVDNDNVCVRLGAVTVSQTWRTGG